MRRFVIASHHLMASGLKDTLEFLTSRTGIIDISAYMDDSNLEERIQTIFEGFSEDDEVVMMTDMLGGSVNQKLFPYMTEHRHLISGINLPCALSLILQPDDAEMSMEQVSRIVEEAKNHLIYVNQHEDLEDPDDE
jgi:PTS system mannose-specific IIA component